MNQDRFFSLFFLITGPFALALIELHATKNATELYHILTNTFSETSHPKRNLLAKAKLSETHVKDHTWYFDSAAGVHTTHHLRDYINADLDDSQEAIETANGKILYTQGARTIATEVIVNGVCNFVHIHNVHYCPEIDSNLLSLSAFTAKRLEFHTSKGTLNVTNLVGETILQSKCKGKVYPLSQPVTSHPSCLASADTDKRTLTLIQPVGDNLVDMAGQPQPGGPIEYLPSTATSQVLDIADNIQLGTGYTGGDLLDNALDSISQLLAETRAATNTSTSLRKIDTNLAINYTSPPQDSLILGHPSHKTPKTYQDAITGSQTNKWPASQPKGRNFRITIPPFEKCTIPEEWDLRIKENSHSTIACYKARWVAKRNVQVKGPDHDKFTPIVKSDTTHILLSVPVTRNWKMRQKHYLNRSLLLGSCPWYWPGLAPLQKDRRFGRRHRRTTGLRDRMFE